MYGMSGVGAEDYGPPAPTVVDQAGQVVRDFTGIPIQTMLLYGAGAALLYYILTAPQTE